MLVLYRQYSRQGVGHLSRLRQVVIRHRISYSLLLARYLLQSSELSASILDRQQCLSSSRWRKEESWEFLRSPNAQSTCLLMKSLGLRRLWPLSSQVCSLPSHTSSSLRTSNGRTNPLGEESDASSWLEAPSVLAFSGRLSFATVLAERWKSHLNRSHVKFYYIWRWQIAITY